MAAAVLLEPALEAPGWAQAQGRRPEGVQRSVSALADGSLRPGRSEWREKPRAGLERSGETVATRIDWQDFEDRVRRARFTVDFPVEPQGRRQFLIPVYLFWSDPPSPRRPRYARLKVALVFASVLIAGAGLGIGLAAVLLP